MACAVKGRPALGGDSPTNRRRSPDCSYLQNSDFVRLPLRDVDIPSVPLLGRSVRRQPRHGFRALTRLSFVVSGRLAIPAPDADRGGCSPGGSGSAQARVSRTGPCCIIAGDEPYHPNPIPNRAFRGRGGVDWSRKLSEKGLP